MVKEVALIKRKAGLSREEFVERYEGFFAPLVVEHCPAIRRYVRNYIVKTVLVPPGARELEFDCITEVWYDDIEGFKAVGSFMMSEAGSAARERLFDIYDSLVFLVEEKASE